MNRAHERESAYLATAAGLSSGQQPAAVEAGRRVEQLARDRLAAPSRSSEPEPRAVSPSLATGSRRPRRRPRDARQDRIWAVLRRLLPPGLGMHAIVR